MPFYTAGIQHKSVQLMTVRHWIFDIVGGSVVSKIFYVQKKAMERDRQANTRTFMRNVAGRWAAHSKRSTYTVVE